jgi:hypothetical protein
MHHWLLLLAWACGYMKQLMLGRAAMASHANTVVLQAASST